LSTEPTPALVVVLMVAYLILACLSPCDIPDSCIPCTVRSFAVQLVLFYWDKPDKYKGPPAGTAEGATVRFPDTTGFNRVTLPVRGQAFAFLTGNKELAKSAAAAAKAAAAAAASRSRSPSPEVRAPASKLTSVGPSTFGKDGWLSSLT
jgi:hypothetical protein